MAKAATLNQNQVLSTETSAVKQPNLLANHEDTGKIYYSADGYYYIWMPGKITTNKANELSSVSYFPETYYTMLVQKMDFLEYSLSNKMIYDILDGGVSALSESQNLTIITKKYLKQSEALGLEFTALNSEGLKVKSQFWMKGKKMYMLMAMTKTELGNEVDKFFNSLVVY